MRPDYAVVIPTVGRRTLERVVRPLVEADPANAPAEIVVVDDRPHPDAPLPVADSDRVRILRSGGNGPALAREVGWRATRSEWVAFLDDDVEPADDWPARLCGDLAGVSDQVGGSQGRIVVPRPPGRRPTDAERATLALEDARWATADMAYRRDVLEEVGGFDPRFPRAYREDTDLALRVMDAGYRLVRGARVCPHPLRPGGRWAGLAAQRGNADDALMRRLHGPGWRRRVAEPPGRLRGHAAVTAVLAAGAAAALTRRRRLALGFGAVWLAGTAEFAWRRIAPGPRTPAEVADMVVTSALIPPLACWQRVRGELRSAGPLPARPPVRAVLFDRDGTLVEDVPYNGDPEKVRPVPAARAALDLARRAGLRVGVVSNQSGIARGLVTAEQVDAVNARVAELLGPFDVWRVCPHDDGDGCRCRKPGPGMIEDAAAELGLSPRDCAVVGDIGADVDAALEAGARPVLVPTEATLAAERLRAPETAVDLIAAVRLLVEGRSRTAFVARWLSHRRRREPEAFPEPGRGVREPGGTGEGRMSGGLARTRPEGSEGRT
ncbi:HAD-IIIA family hydrolase [Actinorugispora endophytica]|uniref:D,D-heptose 1,7-bisphosphate phosphatase n=1 Tax=Actinorugispora endophytica TaxID=1605990 RepID=A0A4R6UWB5_9ACTN|nr:HAD-IIIA family hydrolase [Actinorugispora endophytica]TDQ51541.1 histidinol-phosphate phosphatase family protein/HAD superfamily hydrolase (TIGR01662 family) [Actinorugispora endophytica]